MEQLDVLRHAADVLESMDLRYAIVGSYATLAYGESRFTHDVDIVVELPRDRITEFCGRFPAPEWYVSESAANEAVQRRRQFNVIHTTSGNKLDFMIPKRDEWGRSQLDRRQAVGILPERIVFAAHPEDVILGKLQYFHEGGSDKHLRDICGILQTSGEMIDRDNVRRWAEKLGVTAAWDAVLFKLKQSDPHRAN